MNATAYAVVNPDGYIMAWTIRDSANLAQLTYESMYSESRFRESGLRVVRVTVEEERG